MKGSRPLTDEEIELILKSFKGRFAARDRALFTLGVKTGLRISEILSLKISDIFQHGRIVERVYVQRKNIKGKTHGRTVLLHPEVKQAVALWLNESAEIPSDYTYLFKSRKGSNQPISRKQAWRILDTLISRVGLSGKFGTHTMRKSFAKKIYELLDHDLVKTQKSLGHVSIQSTVSYLSFDQGEIDNAILSL